MVSFSRIVLFLSCFILIVSCQRPLIVDDDQGMDGNHWEQVDIQTNRLIQGLHATPFEWYLITENQFSRFDTGNRLLEQRPLSSDGGVKGVPAISDNTFARVTIDDDGQPLIGFHLARNPSQIIQIPSDSLKGPGDDLLEIDFFSRSVGVFSDDGTLFLLPAKVFPDRHYELLLFEIRLNPAHDEFISLDLIRRIGLDKVSADVANVVSLRFLDGNYYVATREGAYRVTPAGAIKEIFPQWMIDFFSWRGHLYATGINDYDLHKSSDNGLSWERMNLNSAMKFVETAGDVLVTQMAQGNVFNYMPEDLLNYRIINYPAGIQLSQPIFYDVAFFNGHYYFSMDRSVYTTTEIDLQ